MGNIVSRFPGGVNDTTPGDWNEDIAQLNPLRHITYFEDFAANTAFPIAASGLAAASTSTWTVTVTEAGAGNAAAALVTGTGGSGGILQLTTDAADNDLIFAQRAGEPFIPVVGKKLAFKIRMKLTDANANAASINESEWYFGIMDTDTDPLSATAGKGVTDGLFFMKEDGTQNIAFYAQKDTTTGQLATTSVSTLTVNTYTTFAFVWDGAQYIRLYKDDAWIATADLTTTPSTYLPDTGCTVSFGIKNGEAVAKVMSLDYIYCVAER